MGILQGNPAQRARGRGRRFDACWNQHSVRDLEHASHAADRVLLDLKRAGYGQRDLDGMKLALDEAIANAILSRGWRHPQEVCLAVRYRINPSYAAVEVEVHGAGGHAQAPKSGLRCCEPERTPAPPCIVPYLTWIHYSRKDHSATLCQCSLLK